MDDQRYWQRDDIVARLRMEASINQGNAKLCGEAADKIEMLRAENNKQLKWIADAAYLLQGVPVNTPAFEAHRILCGMPPEVK